jgi:hypothetical protein
VVPHRGVVQTQTEEEQLEALKTSVEALTATQARLEAAVTSFSTSVQSANADAEKRAADTTIPALITRGRLQMEADEAATQALLTEIIGNQNKVCYSVQPCNGLYLLCICSTTILGIFVLNSTCTLKHINSANGEQQLKDYRTCTAPVIAGNGACGDVTSIT